MRITPKDKLLLKYIYREKGREGVLYVADVIEALDLHQHSPLSPRASATENTRKLGNKLKEKYPNSYIQRVSGLGRGQISLWHFSFCQDLVSLIKNR